METTLNLKRNEILGFKKIALVILMLMLLGHTFIRINNNFSFNSFDPTTKTVKVQEYEPSKQMDVIKAEKSNPSINALFVGCNGFY